MQVLAVTGPLSLLKFFSLRCRLLIVVVAIMEVFSATEAPGGGVFRWLLRHSDAVSSPPFFPRSHLQAATRERDAHSQYFSLSASPWGLYYSRDCIEPANDVTAARHDALTSKVREPASKKIKSSWIPPAIGSLVLLAKSRNGKVEWEPAEARGTFSSCTSVAMPPRPVIRLFSRLPLRRCQHASFACLPSRQHSHSTFSRISRLLDRSILSYELRLRRPFPLPIFPSRKCIPLLYAC